ncbi:hypothetical protein M9Y10_043719 [Tritrichomonas musculus]|uniref:Uncharacterized protein n=1 Tax=Tritrichomonas musculus TaxID=1915356 RepID=A0ABR2K0I9_9EUKA
MNYQSVTILVKQMEIIIIDLLREFELVNDSDVSRSVLEQMRNTNIHPHDIEAFKKYKPSTGNKIISYFEGFAHPVKLITSIPVAIGGKLRPALKKQRDIDNVDKMNRWFTKGLLSAKISVFQNCIVHMLLKYRKFSRIEQKNVQ